MIKHGARPTRINHLDRDYHKSFGTTGSTDGLPAEYFTDASSDFPDQNADGQPYGCTNYTQAALATDLTSGQRVYKPSDLEVVTHANQQGGYDIRQSLLKCCPPTMSDRLRLGWIAAFYQIKPSGIIDAFDAFRLAQISGQPERRSLSIGTPWFTSWEQAIQRGIRIMPMPTDDELALIRKNSGMYPWHNSEFGGWTTTDGVLLYRDKSWQGSNVGYVYFSREVINVVLSIKGTVGFTATNQTPTSIQTIDVSAVQFIVSFIRNLLSKIYE